MKAGEKLIDSQGRTWTAMEFQEIGMDSFLEGLGRLDVQPGELVRTPVIAGVFRLESAKIPS